MDDLVLSLNMMSSAGTKMYIAARIKSEVKDEVLKKCAARIYTIGKDDFYKFILTPLDFDSEQQILNETCNLAASAII